MPEKEQKKLDDIEFAKEIIEISNEVDLLDIKKLEKNVVKRMYKDEKGYFGEMEEELPEGVEIIRDEWDVAAGVIKVTKE